MKSIIAVLLLCFCVSTMNAQTKYTTDWESLKKHKVAPEWFADAKLGVYFHWGVYSVPAYGSEWYPRWMYVPDKKEGFGSTTYKYHEETYGRDFQYHDFIKEWKAENFSAKEWVDMFENMGAKFIGSIAEHHDGFSLWDSEVNEWNSAQMGPHINVVKAISDEVKKRDLKFMTTFHHGFHNLFYPKPESSYLRPSSRHIYAYENCEVPQDPKYRKLYCNMGYEEAEDLWLAKLNEVIDTYCPDYIWMDFGPRYIQDSYRKQFLANYFNKAAELGKEVVVNTKGDCFPTDIAVVNVERATMEDITSEVWITDFILGAAWSYNKFRRTAIQSEKAIRMLADVVSKNGVMLLSAGPKADGTIPIEQVKAMEGIGAWMRPYGEAIYETRPFVAYGEGTTILKRDPADEWNEYGRIKKNLDKLNAEDLRYTSKGNIVYAIQLGWNNEEPTRTLTTFADKAKNIKVKSVTVLGSNEKIKWKRTSKGLTVTQPKEKPAEADAALVYKIEVRK
ncbi:alpha-L-fucosidase [Lutibacter citreus]|uniref:alpha-L-fucosidase n=1 Tax=Lutibacter citreus TaxID=2138210 RepID=UPI000DBE0129|nr:alpha-L-fucosidase [Lutibacter citreus]